MSKRAYPLDIEDVSRDTYALMSKGHHDVHEFMHQVRADGYTWPLGMPRHVWLRCIPPSYAAWYVEAKAGARGAFPATQCCESSGDELYENIDAASPVSTCVACEGKPAVQNSPCAVCGMSVTPNAGSQDAAVGALNKAGEA